MPIVLGGIVFKDYEIPKRVQFGGRQSLAIHKLLGGARVVDGPACGPCSADYSAVGPINV